MKIFWLKDHNYYHRLFSISKISKRYAKVDFNQSFKETISLILDYFLATLKHRISSITGWVPRYYVVRVAQLDKKSPECLADGACKMCGCKMPDMLFAEHTCENHCYCTIKEYKDAIKTYK